MDTHLIHTQPLRDLEYRISVFLENYLIVEQESLLGETASKLEATTKQAHIVSRSVV